MKKIATLLLSLLFFINTSYAQPVNGVILSDTGNLTVVKVWGTHYERGYAYGNICGDKLMSFWNNYIIPSYGTYLPLARLIISNENYFSIDSLYVLEAKGVIDGIGAAGGDTSGINYIDLFVVNFLTDLEGFLPKKESSVQNCSSLMNWGAATTGTDLNGKSVISHHLDALSLDTMITQNQVMIIQIPSESDEQPWLMTGIAGQMVASQAVNQSGIAVFLNTVNGFNAQINMAYEPMTLAIRKGIEKKDYNGDGAHNTNDIRDALNSNTNGFASGFIVCAIAPSTEGIDSLVSMVAECTPQTPYITYRNINDVDSIDGHNLYAANSMIKRNNAQGYCSRYLNVSDSINNYFNGINIGSFDNWEIMRTQSTQSTNLQFIQVIPELDMLKIAVSKLGVPAYKSQPMIFNLSDLFYCSSVNEISNHSDGLTVYPNPTTGSIHIELHEATGTTRYEIFDLTGRILVSAAINQTAIADLSDFTNGCYLLKVYSENSVIIKKILKQ
jgi:hypothetical protein